MPSPKTVGLQRFDGRSNLAPEDPGIFVREGGPRDLARALAERGEPSDPLLFRLVKVHDRLHDGRAAHTRAELRRIGGVLNFPDRPAPPVPMREARPDRQDGAPASQAEMAAAKAAAAKTEGAKCGAGRTGPAAAAGGRAATAGGNPAPAPSANSAKNCPQPPVTDRRLSAAGSEDAVGRQSAVPLRAERERPGAGVTAGETAPSSDAGAAGRAAASVREGKGATRPSRTTKPRRTSPASGDGRQGKHADDAGAASDEAARRHGGGAAVAAAGHCHESPENAGGASQAGNEPGSEPRPSVAPSLAELPAAVELAAPPVTLDLVLAHVCAEYRVKPAEIRGPSRVKRIVEPRMVAVWLGRRLTGRSLNIAARCIVGGRDHSTVLHDEMRIAARVGIDADFAARMAGLEARIRCAAGRDLPAVVSRIDAAVQRMRIDMAAIEADLALLRTAAGESR